jgi:hypothetical protein
MFAVTVALVMSIHRDETIGHSLAQATFRDRTGGARWQ